MSRGSMERLTASDGHQLDTYVARPIGRPKAGLVILQEIFGVTDYMKRTADEYAADGYLVVVPALFDRVQRGLVLQYSEVQSGREAVGKLTEPMLIADLTAATAAASEIGAVAHIGYCWGGALAYLAACQIPGVASAVCYYGTRIIQYSETFQPRIPVLYHFGANDRTIPPEAIAKIHAANPSGIFYIYEGADHGFACTERSQFNAEATKSARTRTLSFLADTTG